MEALKDRVSAVQRFIDAPSAQKSKDKDVYEPNRELIRKEDEMSIDKVKDYLALPESEKTKRRTINCCDIKIDNLSLANSRELIKKYKGRLQAEAGITEAQLKSILSGGIHHDGLHVTGGLSGNRIGNSLYFLGTQDTLNDEDYYQIMKGLYAEPLSEYTHESKEFVRQQFNLAIDKIKDLAVDRFGRFIEKYGELPALLNPDDLLVVMNSAEYRAAVIIIQDINQLIDEVKKDGKKASLFDENNPRDVKLLAMKDYINALNDLYMTYEQNVEDYSQDQSIELDTYDEDFEHLPGNADDLDVKTLPYEKSVKAIIEAVRKLGKGPSMSKEEYDAYIAECEKRLKTRPVARKYLEVQKEVLADHKFVKKEKPVPEDDSDYVARVEELRKRGNTSVTVEGLKMRDKYLKADTDKRREVNAFLAEHGIKSSDFESVFDARSPRMFLQSYEKDESGNPADEVAKKIHEQNLDFLKALFTGDRLRLRPHINRLISRFLSYDISAEHIQDKNWILKHPEIFDYFAMAGYMVDCMEKNEEFAWYFEELAPDVRAAVYAKCRYIGSFSTLAQTLYLNPVLGFRTSSTDMEIYLDRNAEQNCSAEKDAWTALQSALEEEREDKKDDHTDCEYTDYEKILTLDKKSRLRTDAIERYEGIYQEKRGGYIESNQNKLNALDKFYKKYGKNFAGKAAPGSSSGGVTRLLKGKTGKNSSREQTAEALTQNWNLLVKYAPVGKEDVKIGNIKSIMKDVSTRSNTRITLLMDDEQRRAQFKEICANFPDELRQRSQGQLDMFYSFFLSNAALWDKDLVAANLEYVIRSYFEDDDNRKMALNIITQDILTIARNRENFDEKNLQSSRGLAMARMAKDYNEMLRQNPGYVNYLKSTTDPDTGRTYADIVGETLDIIRVCGSYARIYNTLSRDPYYASSSAAFLSAPVKAGDSYYITRAKATISTLNDMADKIKKGEYKRIDIDRFDLIDEEEKRVDGICAKFSEPVGKEAEAIQDIDRGLKEKINAMDTPDQKVLELTRLLTSLDSMQETLGWEEDEVLPSVIGEIINNSPEELKNAAVLLRDRLYKKLKADYDRFLGKDVPKFLADPEYTGDKELQKKNAALLMLTTTTSYRRIKGLEKLLEMMEVPPYKDEKIVLTCKQAERSFAASSEPAGLSKEGVLEVRDHVRRVNLRCARAMLSKHTSPENVGFMEHNHITQEEIQEWFKNLPKQEEKALKAPKVPTDPELLRTANEILPGIQKEFSNRITAEHVVLMENYKKQESAVEGIAEAYLDKWLKQASDCDIDTRDYRLYQISGDGGSLEILLEDEPEIREFYLESYIRTLMNFEFSPENLTVEWALSHVNEINCILCMGTYFQNMKNDNPDYFKAMPGDLQELLAQKALMVGYLGTAITYVFNLDDVSFITKKYLPPELSSGDPDYVKQVKDGIAAATNGYLQCRQKILWFCRNKAMENVQGIEKYRMLRAEISSVTYNRKTLGSEEYKKPVQGLGAGGASLNDKKRYAKKISDGSNETRDLINEAQGLIPQEIEGTLELGQLKVLCSMYPYILGKYENDAKEFAEEEFKKLCLRFAGKEGMPSEEEAVQQKMAALDSMAEYIMLFGINNPGIIETDEVLASNAPDLEKLAPALEAMKSAMNDNPAWMEEKNSKVTSSGKTEGEILTAHLSVLENLVKDYKARKAVITANIQ
jgi:hypothetical protein